MNTRPVVPSCASALSSPLLARKLNERSFRPPMSVTRPALIDLPSVVEVLPLPPPLSSSSPHAATPSASAARSASRRKRKDLGTFGSPSLSQEPRHPTTFGLTAV